MQDFVHLHVHTQYSILDGQASVKRLVDKAISDGMKGIAVTDHGNMMAIKEFYNYVNKINKGKSNEEKFKPIIGCEVYVAERRLFNREQKEDIRGHHLILLAKNEKGYHNLIKIVSKAWSEGYYYNPRTDKVELEKYREGLICCSACLGGEVPQLIKNGNLERAEEVVRWYKSIFGDDYYLELQLHKATVERANHEVYPLQLEVNKHIIELSKKCNVKLVCTNDVHFVDEENAEAHDRLICLSTGKDLDKSVGGGVPGGVASCLEGGAETAGGEGGGIGFALYELLARKFHNYFAVTHGGDEAVVLFGGDAGQGLEPVGEVSGALFDRPLLHSLGDHVEDGEVKGSAVVDGTLHSGVGLGGETFLHSGVAEYKFTKMLGNVFHKYPFCIDLAVQRGSKNANIYLLYNKIAQMSTR